MTYQSHIKASYLKSLVQADTPCEEKIQNIERLLGLPVSDSVEVGVTGDENSKSEADVINNNANQEAVLDKRSKAHEKILEGLSGKSEKLARGLLQRIESMDNLNYDYNNLEISINSEVKRYSSIRSLIHRTVQVASPNLPLHFTEFINALLMNKTAIHFLINSDALNIRQGLIQIHEGKRIALEGDTEVKAYEESAGAETNGNDVNGEVVEKENESSDGVINVGEIEGGGKESEESSTGIRKRKRDEEDEDEDEVRDGKRKKSVTFDESTNVAASGKGKRKREEKEDEESKVGKKKKTETKAKPPSEGERRSKRIELKSKLKKDWLSSN